MQEQVSEISTQTGPVNFRGDNGAGTIMGAAAQFNVTVRGKGGHAAMPHTTVDPVVAGAAIVTALQVGSSPQWSPFMSILYLPHYRAEQAQTHIIITLQLSCCHCSCMPPFPPLSFQSIMLLANHSVKKYFAVITAWPCHSLLARDAYIVSHVIFMVFPAEALTSSC